MRKSVAGAVFGVTVVILAASGCSGGGKQLPDGLYGTWNGGSSTVSSVSFTEGGRFEINGSSCAGSYALSAVGENVASLRSGYLKCPDLGLDGYVTSDVSIDGSTLTLSGFPVGGSYEKG